MITNNFFDFLSRKLKEVQETEIKAIEEAAKLIVDSINKGGRFYVFGTGHSHIIAEEIYLRAGGLAYVNAVLPTELMLHELALKSTYVERIEGYANHLVDLYKMSAEDTLMVVSNSGRNAVPVDLCLEAKKRGLSIIVITSVKAGKGVASRHSSGYKIADLADVVIDNCADEGDASYYIDNFDIPVGPLSDFTGVAIAQALMADVVDELVKQGHKPPVFKSSNLDGADEYNDELFDKYYGYWK
ncbi:MAG: SIS domain-containing protein [Erysipelotrichaceae bacterium]|nr:SIS domain-containing protein [Erysipelotrichaceae bacterium]